MIENSEKGDKQESLSCYPWWFAVSHFCFWGVLLFIVVAMGNLRIALLR